MKNCQACRALFEGESWVCPSCGFKPREVMGFPLLAPALEDSQAGYQIAYFDEIHLLEDSSFWFRARNDLILWAMATYFPQAGQFLETGCGTGYVLKGLRCAFPDLALWGSELSSRGLTIAAKRVEGVHFLQMDARDVPFTDAFDVVGMFDVLEHIPEDGQVLGQIARALRPGGGLLITVPQHPWLWSEVDQFARHVRRYRKADLISLLRASGFDVVRSTSFVSLLLPALALSRLANRAADPELRMGPVRNFLLGLPMTLERWAIRAGISFPAGGSLLVIARKR